LKDWETAEHFAEVATQNFPKNKHFRRWRATAQAERGNLAEAVDELSSLCSTGRPEWYELHDLALYEARLGNLQDALLHATRAALAHGKNEQKVNLYQLMGHLWLKMDDYDKAAKMLTMTRLVYAQKDWNIPEKLEKLERATAKKLDETGQCWPDTPNDASSIWHEMRHVCQEIEDSTLDFHLGKVKMVDEERGFGFIRPDDGSEDAYFKIRDAYKNITQGQQVRYVVIERVDPKDKQVKPTAIKISLQPQASEVQ
jgi:cold shock CspA family protein